MFTYIFLEMYTSNSCKEAIITNINQNYFPNYTATISTLIISSYIKKKQGQKYTESTKSEVIVRALTIESFSEITFSEILRKWYFTLVTILILNVALLQELIPPIDLTVNSEISSLFSCSCCPYNKNKSNFTFILSNCYCMNTIPVYTDQIMMRCGYYRRYIIWILNLSH